MEKSIIGWSRRLLPLLLYLAVAGCGGVVVVNTGGGSYDIGDFDYATRKGAIETIIAGNPFNGDKTAFDARVLELIQGQNRGPGVDFVPRAGPRTDQRFKVVIVFNPTADAGRANLCRDAPTAERPSAARQMRVWMAFCDGTTVKSSANGSIGNVAAVDDPNFGRLLRQTIYFMTPDDNYLRQRQADN